jgi:hypothetical protein
MTFAQIISTFFIIALFFLLSNINLFAQEYKLLKNAKIYTLGKKDVLEKGMIFITHV